MCQCPAIGCPLSGVSAVRCCRAGAPSDVRRGRWPVSGMSVSGCPVAAVGCRAGVSGVAGVGLPGLAANGSYVVAAADGLYATHTLPLRNLYG